MNFRKSLYYLVFAISLVACSTNEKKSINASDPYKDVVLGEDLIRAGMPEKLDYLIENLVISDEMIGLIAEEDKSLFDVNLLNPTDYVKYYNTSKVRAVNMGVYGAELNYLIHFEQTQYSMRYMIASKQIADLIGVAMAFDQQTVEEYQTNVENKDSLINIIFVVYDNAKRMLKNEEQFMLSSLIIVGSWIENMYVTTKIFEHTKSVSLKSKLITKIIEQKEYLNKVLEAVVCLDEGDNVFVTDIIQSLQSIVTVYEGFGDSVLSEEDVKTLNSAVTNVRTRIVSVK
ncbi:MAG: hypothetical protein MJ198_06895 [Bacteroidales bacterium]|nr:hypothetical protein [Bacteroidales bacterium]